MANKNNRSDKKNIRYISTTEAARLLGVTTNTVRRWVKAGKIRGKKIMGRWRVLREDIEKLIEE